MKLSEMVNSSNISSLKTEQCFRSLNMELLIMLILNADKMKTPMYTKTNIRNRIGSFKYENI